MFHHTAEDGQSGLSGAESNKSGEGKKKKKSEYNHVTAF